MHEHINGFSFFYFLFFETGNVCGFLEFVLELSLQTRLVSRTHRDPPASASQVLGLMLCAIINRHEHIKEMYIYKTENFLVIAKTKYKCLVLCISWFNRFSTMPCVTSLIISLFNLIFRFTNVKEYIFKLSGLFTGLSAPVFEIIIIWIQ